jgi:hypothetical protein
LGEERSKQVVGIAAEVRRSPGTRLKEREK